jgi:hypothetical protein
LKCPNVEELSILTTLKIFGSIVCDAIPLVVEF